MEDVRKDPQLELKLRKIRALIVRRLGGLKEGQSLKIDVSHGGLRFELVSPEEVQIADLGVYASASKFWYIKGNLASVLRMTDFDWMRGLFGVKPMHWAPEPGEYDEEEKLG